MQPNEITHITKLVERARRIASEEKDKVIPLTERKPKESDETPAPETDFEAIARANKEKAERRAKERAEANKKVLRSYRIKS
jgi:hypothetical protein